MSPNDLRKLLPSAWSLESASVYRADNPAYGQCSVTALVVLRLFGGDLLKTPIGEQSHFYNRLDGKRVDLTDGQFSRLPDYQDLVATVEETLSDTSVKQVDALLFAVLSAHPGHFDRGARHTNQEPISLWRRTR